MEMSKVSVIIPVFNSLPFLGNALNSVLPLPEVGEIILVDDGSTDGSFDLGLDLVGLDSRIKLLHHPGRINKGASESRNLGITNANCPYIAFLDSDDFYLPNRFKKTIEFLEGNLKYDGCFGKVEIRNENGDFVKFMGFPEKEINSDIFSLLLKGGYFHTNSITVRRDFFLKCGLFDPKLKVQEDVELWIRMAHIGNLYFLKEEKPLSVYICRNNSLVSKSNGITRFTLWKTVSNRFLGKNISFKNNAILIKQLIKWKVKSLISD